MHGPHPQRLNIQGGVFQPQHWNVGNADDLFAPRSWSGGTVEFSASVPLPAIHDPLIRTLEDNTMTLRPGSQWYKFHILSSTPGTLSRTSVANL